MIARAKPELVILHLGSWRPRYSIGRLSGRNLSWNWIVPFSMKEWDGERFRFAWRNLFSPGNWWWSIRHGEWRVHWHTHHDANHRCYCPCGVMRDGTIVLAGFGVVWWYSRFTGDVPCPCDEAIQEVFE